MQRVNEVDVVAAVEQKDETRLEQGILGLLQRRRVVVVAVLFAVGFCARLYHIDRIGLSEDETNKIFAVRSYTQGDMTANAEHPMLMKLLCFSSLRVAAAWNGIVGGKIGARLGEET